jgi:hypothetical protein
MYLENRRAANDDLKLRRFKSFQGVTILLSLFFLLPCSSYAQSQSGQRGRPLNGAQKLTSAPASFPVPIYRQNVISTDYTSMPTANGNQITATTRTNDAPSVPFEWYQNFLNRNGWSVDLPKNEGAPPAMRNGNLLMLKANKDNDALMIICSKMPRSPYTTVSVCSMHTK